MLDGLRYTVRRGPYADPTRNFIVHSRRLGRIVLVRLTRLPGHWVHWLVIERRTS
jgi:hypothetical protein